MKATKTTSLRQINIITIKEYTQSNKELFEDDPHNTSMSVDEYINMVLGQYLDEGNKKVESVELFYNGIMEMIKAQPGKIFILESEIPIKLYEQQ